MVLLNKRIKNDTTSEHVTKLITTMSTISKKYTNNIISKKLNKTDWNDLKLKEK